MTSGNLLLNSSVSLWWGQLVRREPNLCGSCTGPHMCRYPSIRVHVVPTQGNHTYGFVGCLSTLSLLESLCLLPLKNYLKEANIVSTWYSRVSIFLTCNLLQVERTKLETALLWGPTIGVLFLKPNKNVACIEDTASVEYLIFYISWSGHSEANILKK